MTDAERDRVRSECKQMPLDELGETVRRLKQQLEECSKPVLREEIHRHYQVARYWFRHRAGRRVDEPDFDEPGPEAPPGGF